MRWAIRLGCAVLAAGLSWTHGHAADPIRFGAILPLTGPGAVVGTQEQRGIQFAIDEANAKGGVLSHPIEVLFEDNQAKPDQSILSFNKLVDLQHVPVIFTGYSGPSLAMAPLATRKKVLMVNAGAQSDKLATASPYLINTLPSTSDEMTVITQYLISKGKKTAALLYKNDAAGIGGRDDFLTAYPKAGGTILAQEPVQFGQTDYRPALLKLAASNPDVLFVIITAGMPALADEIKQMDAHFLVAGTSFFTDPAVIADPASAGFVHSQVRIDAPPELAAAFKAKFSTDMDFFGRQYYNATEIVLTTLAKVLADKQDVTGENMRAALFAIRKFQGLIPMEFTSNTASVPIDINEMRGGKDVTLVQLKAQ